MSVSETSQKTAVSEFKSRVQHCRRPREGQQTNPWAPNLFLTKSMICVSFSDNQRLTTDFAKRKKWWLSQQSCCWVRMSRNWTGWIEEAAANWCLCQCCSEYPRNIHMGVYQQMDWERNMRYIYNRILIRHETRKILSAAGQGVQQEGILAGEVSQAWGDKCWVFSLLGGS